MGKDRALREFEGEILELIGRRRRQVMIHSYNYYRLNISIITDKQFDSWAYELARLQNQYPDISAQCLFYPKEFEGFDGTTGFNLPLYEPWLELLAKSLINYKKKGM